MVFRFGKKRNSLRGTRKILPVWGRNKEGNEGMTDLTKVAAERGIKYFLISFVDLFGTMRAKLVPAAAIGDMAKTGAGFAGFASWLDMTPADPDMFAIPDPDSLIQLPWKKDVGWLAAAPYMNGEPVAQAPRNVLKRVIETAGAKGYELKTGVECEYFLITPDGTAISDASDRQSKPCYDQQALMRRYDVITEICDSMLELGWGPYQNDHEDANGQFEMNWEYDHALRTADKHAFFKYMVKSIAEKHGLRATFMPKPFAHLTGNGCHAHVSLWSKTDGRNLFDDPNGELGVSALGYNFLAGVLNSADALAAITNPTVNSYKRINAPRTTSGATWSPNTVTYAGNNRTHMVRIPDPGRFEVRLADGATNPYLLPAGLLVAGLDGIENKRDPGPRLDIDMYAEGHKVTDAKRLPLNLLDALRAFEGSDILKAGLGEPFVSAYTKLRTADWNDFTGHLTEWERSMTLDC
jgi:glutamate---methylamine ligase